MSEIKFKITNLTCEACVKLSIMALKKIPGVSDAQVDSATGVSIVRSDKVITLQEIDKILAQVDKKVAVLN